MSDEQTTASTGVGLSEILEIVKGVLQFPAAILSLVRVLKRTPSENQDAVIAAARVEADKYEETGRPTW